MEEQLQKLEAALLRCESAAHRLAKREATLRGAASEALAELDRLLSESENEAQNG